MIARAVCFFRGHYGDVEAPCRRCGSYVSYEGFAVHHLNLSLTHRLSYRWWKFKERRARRLAWRSQETCAECGKRRKGCDDCIPF